MLKIGSSINCTRDHINDDGVVLTEGMTYEVVKVNKSSFVVECDLGYNVTIKNDSKYYEVIS